jgi:hypothetical protein
VSEPAEKKSIAKLEKDNAKLREIAQQAVDELQRILSGRKFWNVKQGKLIHGFDDCDKAKAKAMHEEKIRMGLKSELLHLVELPPPPPKI